MKRVLITGAAGFIGYHLAKTLSARGDAVIGLDNFNNYYSQDLKRAREAELQQCGVSIVHGDIQDASLLHSMIEQHQITHLVNLAAQAGVRYSLANPFAYIESNINGFLHVLEACRKYEGVKLIYASSSSVYGLNEESPFSIKDRTDHQASLYGVTKKSNELMAHAYHHLYNIPVTGLRFFTVYGPWGRPDMAYYSFCEAIEQGKPIKIFNHGKMRRDFTYIDDIVAGIVAAIDLESKCEIFNLGNCEPVDLLHFVQVIEEAMGKKAEKLFLPMEKGDVLETFAEIEESERRLNFKPATSIEKGIPLFVDWYKRYHQKNSV